mmetsp:Transcript_22746/g.74037  ORF Transcript_22746/g.74037 Transcript_22746/m.74037 type:complete len:520 (+) Transcript_22746:1879-3438(+)
MQNIWTFIITTSLYYALVWAATQSLGLIGFDEEERERAVLERGCERDSGDGKGAHGFGLACVRIDRGDAARARARDSREAKAGEAEAELRRERRRPGLQERTREREQRRLAIPADKGGGAHARGAASATRRDRDVPQRPPFLEEGEEVRASGREEPQIVHRARGALGEEGIEHGHVLDVWREGGRIAAAEAEPPELGPREKHLRELVAKGVARARGEVRSVEDAPDADKLSAVHRCKRGHVSARGARLLSWRVPILVEGCERELHRVRQVRLRDTLAEHRVILLAVASRRARFSQQLRVALRPVTTTPERMPMPRVVTQYRCGACRLIDVHSAHAEARGDLCADACDEVRPNPVVGWTHRREERSAPVRLHRWPERACDRGVCGGRKRRSRERLCRVQLRMQLCPVARGVREEAPVDVRDDVDALLSERPPGLHKTLTRREVASRVVCVEAARDGLLAVAVVAPELVPERRPFIPVERHRSDRESQKLFERRDAPEHHRWIAARLFENVECGPVRVDPD